MRKVGRIERRRRRFSLGTFFLGSFMGFLLTIAIVTGIGFFAYHNVSINWINNLFNKNLDLGNKDLNGLTLKNLTAHTLNLVKNTGNYTLNDLKNDFGIDIGDEFAGINIEDLKDIPLNDFQDALKEKLSNISAYELSDAMDFSSVSTLLNESITYYYNSADSKLYKDNLFLEEVEFNYKVQQGSLFIKEKQFNIISGEVNVQLKYLPLVVAFDNLISVYYGDNITLGELESELNIVFPAAFDKISRSIALSSLNNAISNLHFADFLGYTIVGDDVYNLDNELENGIIAKIAKMQISNCDTLIQSLTISDLFDDVSEGVLSLIDADTNVKNVVDKLAIALSTKTIGELYSKKVLATNGKYEQIKNEYIDLDLGEGSGDNLKKISDLLLDEVFDLFFDMIEDYIVIP